MSELTAEEQALLGAAAQQDKPRRGRPPRPEAAPEPVAAGRGPHTPVQWDDDGWGDTPVQMRG